MTTFSQRCEREDEEDRLACCQAVRILIWKDKGGDRHFLANTTEMLYEKALKILDIRYQQGYLDYPDDAQSAAAEIIACEDGARALAFLNERNDFEYERVRLVEINA